MKRAVFFTKTATVEQLILRLSDAMKRSGGRTVRLSKKADGSVLIKTSADRGKDVRDFWKQPA